MPHQRFSALCGPNVARVGTGCGPRARDSDVDRPPTFPSLLTPTELDVGITAADGKILERVAGRVYTNGPVFHIWYVEGAVTP